MRSGRRNLWVTGWVIVLLGIVALWSLADPLQVEGGYPDSEAFIRSIQVGDGDGGPTVKIDARGPLEYSCKELTEGSGLMLSVNAKLAKEIEGEIPVYYNGVTSVEAIQELSSTGPQTTITIRTEQRRDFQVEEIQDGLIVHLKPATQQMVEEDVIPESPSMDLGRSATGFKGARAGAGKGVKTAPAETSRGDQGRADRVVDLQVDERGDSLKAVVVGNGGFGDVKAFSLSRPNRIVLDVKGVRNGLGRRYLLTDGRIVSRVRIGNYPNKLRLVFDLKDQGSDRPSYRLNENGNKLVLLLNPNEEKTEELKAVSSQKPHITHQGPAAERDEKKPRLAEATGTSHEVGSSGVAKGDFHEISHIQKADQEGSTDAPKDKVQAKAAPKASPLVELHSKDQIVVSEVIPASATSGTDPKAVLSPSEMASLEPIKPLEISTGMEPGKVYTGQKINLDFQDIDIHNVFRLLAEVSNLNIVVSDKVKGKVTMRLKDIPWDQALDLILSTHKLGMVRQGNVIRVATLKELIDEQRERKRLYEEKLKEKIEQKKRIEEAQIERRKRQRALRPFITKSFILNYTNAKDVAGQIKGFLTKDDEVKKYGSVVMDERTNTLTVTDYPEKLDFIGGYISRIDKPTPQVLIEARIVKANKNFARELGIQWGGQYAEYEKNGEWAYGLSGGLGGTSPSAWTSGSFSGGTGADFIPLSGWMVNLPASLILGSATPAIGFQVGRLIGDIVNLDLRLSAAESEGLTKIISKPKIMTLDNIEATISQGFEIPFTQVNPEGNVSVVFKEATLKTVVTPLISPDGRVRLKLEVTDDFPDFTRVNQTTGDPAIRKRSASTEVLVRNGETVVIGGIMEETRSFTEAGVPWLKDVPVLSWLFEKKYRSFDQTELLIFITPFIIEAK